MRHIEVVLRDNSVADVFAYRSQLFVLRFDGSLATYSVEAISTALFERHTDQGAAASYALFHSKGIGSSDSVRAAWARLADSRIEPLEVDLAPTDSFSPALEGTAFRDFHAYYNQLFVGSDEGAWVLPLDGAGDVQAHALQPLVRGDVETLTVGLGALAISLGEGGLSVVTKVYTGAYGEPTTVEQVSMRSSLGWGMAVNYPSRKSYRFLSISTEEERGIKRLVSIADGEGAADVVVADADFVAWESGRALASGNGTTKTLGKNRSGYRRVLGQADDTPVVSIAVTGNRVVITETASAVYAALHGETTQILEGQPVSVRTFPSSQRFRRLVAATTQEGIHLHAIYGGPID